MDLAGTIIQKSFQLLNMINDESSDVLIEFIEVFIHQILYLRELYPAKIFRPRKVYNCPVFASIYPPINTYISDVLSTARILKQNAQLIKLEIVIYSEENCVLEKYSIGLVENSLLAAYHSTEDDTFMDLEQRFRTFLYTLPQRMKSLNRLPSGAKFKLQLHTSQTGFVKTCCGPGNEDFPWVQTFCDDDVITKEIKILPLTFVDLTALKIHIEL